MGSSKVKFCKCGHKKESHKKKPESKWSFASYCRDCQCNSYMNRELPDKTSYAFMIFTSIIGLFLIGFTIMVYLEANPENTGTQDNLVDMTLGQLYGILSLLFIVAVIFFGMWFVADPILDVISQRRRGKFPIDDKDE